MKKIMNQKNLHRLIIYSGLIAIPAFITTSLLIKPHEEFVIYGQWDKEKGFFKSFIQTHKKRIYMYDSKIYKVEIYDLKTGKLVWEEKGETNELKQN